MQHNTKC